MSPSPCTEDTLTRQTTAEYQEERLGWESVYAHNHEDFGPDSLLGRASDREVVPTRPLREKLAGLKTAVDFFTHGKWTASRGFRFRSTRVHFNAPSSAASVASTSSSAL